MKSQAEEKNNKDGKNKETVWRVRGSPRSDLYLKRVLKRIDYTSD